MTNSTEQFWDVDGVSLQTLCTNLSTWGGDREGVPGMRGEDTLIPYRAGRRWVEKVVDSRTMGLKGWVVGAAPDGTIGDVETFRANWRRLRSLLWTPGRQFALTRRWLDPTTGLLLTATTMGEFAGGLSPEMTGPNRAYFTVDVHLADPYFYGEPVVIDLDLAVNAVKTVTILGDAPSTKITVDYVGPLTSPQVTVTDVVPQVWVRYLDLPDGSNLHLDVDLFRALQDDGGIVTSVVGNVRHDGHPAWLHFVPGVRDLALTATAGAGTARITYRPAYL